MTDNLVSIFGGAFTPPGPGVEPEPPEVQLADAISRSGLTPPSRIILDGQIHRFNTHTNGKSDNGKTGWYIAYSDGIPSGAFGDWRTGMDQQWRADVGRSLTAVEQMANARRFAEAKVAREEARAKQHEVAAKTVEQIWSGCIGASPEHPYLKSKGVGAHGARATGDGRLVVPMYGVEGSLLSLEYIDSEGDKKYQGLADSGRAFWWIGAAEDARTIYLAEGYATAASIYEATGQPCFVSYSSTKLPLVAKYLRERFGAMQDICIVADNDTYSEVEISNGAKKGREYGEIAAKAASCRVIHIPIEDKDANDYAQAGYDLKALLQPPIGDWLIPADDFCSAPAPISWLVKHWLQDQALIMVHGPSGGGKTFVVLEWCLTIASNLVTWNGHKVRSAPVVYLAGEGHHGLRGRVAAWKVTNPEAGSLDMWLSRDGCDLNTAEGYRRVCDNVRALPVPPKLIVVDTLHRFLQGDENSAQDAKTMLDACNALMSEFDCSVLLVHHTGVSEEAQHRARGSSAWRGALDIEISIIPAKNEQPMQIVQRKSKDAELSEPVYANLKSVPIPGWLDEDGEQVTSAVLVVADAPVEHKANPADKHRKLFENAWWAAGAEERNGMPYLSRSAFINHLVGNGSSEAAAKQATKPSETSRPIGALLLAEIISPMEHGWQVQCPQNGSAMMMRKNGG